MYVRDTASITDSTISGNVATYIAGGLHVEADATIENSTVAFNHQEDGSTFKSGGLYIKKALTLHSSIVADNVSGGAPGDIDGSGTIGGSPDNIITATPLGVPLNTNDHCPKLQPLRDNGGPTMTNAPMASSEAIDQGSAPLTLFIDQRLLPRSQGAGVDIGAVERQPGEKDERIFVSGFDGLCDQ